MLPLYHTYAQATELSKGLSVVETPAILDALRFCLINTQEVSTVIQMILPLVFGRHSVTPVKSPPIPPN